MLTLVVFAAVLRWEQISRLSLVHFDEGVLVSGAFGVWLHGIWHFPLLQPLQAPPLFPWMVAGAFGVSGAPWPIMGIYLSAALGVATVAVFFAFLRRLYGTAPALAGGGLLAASDLHIAFSRMALTDVALTFWFVIGAYLLMTLSDCGAQKLEATHAKRRLQMLGWSVALGLTAGAAWNTKYNGWLLIAIAATAWIIVMARTQVARRSYGKFFEGGEESFSGPRVALAIAIASLIATACFAPWYLHVERTFPGGYSAVTQNHLRYMGGVADWPSRAWRLWTSLAGFRHHGWVATVLATGLAIGCVARRGCISTDGRARRGRATLLLTVFLAGAAWAATVTSGGDAVVFVIGVAAVAPALVWGRWPEVLCAVWAGAFFVLTPFYHPYTRLLVPALPAVIALTIWLVMQAFEMGEARPNGNQHGRDATRLSPYFLSVGCAAALAASLAWHPFGWLPASRVWNRWSTRQSYRALGDAVLDANLPSDAMVLCQGPPAMTLYIEREWTPLETVPFQKWLAHIEPGRECYLAVDFWGAYGENHELALAAILERLECLEPIAVVPNDLNLATLLDYLPPADVARRLSGDWGAKHVRDAHGREVVFPADLNQRYADVIVLYHIDRDCLAK